MHADQEPNSGSHEQASPASQDTPSQDKLRDSKLPSVKREARYRLRDSGIEVTQSEVEEHYKLFKHLKTHDRIGMLMVTWNCFEVQGRFSPTTESAKNLVKQGVAFIGEDKKFYLTDKSRALGQVLINHIRPGEEEVIWPEVFGERPS